MNARIVRKNSLVNVSESAASSALSQRAVLERLRRIIFSSARRRAGTLVVALAAALAGTSDAFAQTQLVFDPTADMVVGGGDMLIVHNDERDLQNPNNDPSKTITLNGGTFSFRSNETIVLGDFEYSYKNWNWGKDGTIDLQGVVYTDEKGQEQIGTPVLQIANANFEGDNLTKTGNGGLELWNLNGDSITFGDLNIEEGSITCYCGGVRFKSGTNNISFGNDSEVPRLSELAVGTPDNSQADAVYVAKGTTLNINAGVVTGGLIRTGANFNSEGKIVLQNGAVVIDVLNNGKEYNELNLNDVDVVCANSTEKKFLELRGGNSFLNRETGQVVTDLTVSINLNGNTVFNGGDVSIDSVASNAFFVTEGKTFIKGSFTHTNGGQARWYGPTTITGEYLSTAIFDDSDEGNIDSFSDDFRGGLEVASNGSLIALDLHWTHYLNISDNGSVILMGESRGGRSSELDPRAYIRLSDNGTLYGACENIDNDLYFDNGGKIVLGNFNFSANGLPDERYWLTVDDVGKATLLKMNLLRRTLNGVVASKNNGTDYLHGSPIFGNGTIEIDSPTGYSQGSEPLSYLAMMTGDKTNFTGNTEIKRGSLVLFCSPETVVSADRSSFQYGSSEKKGVFNVYGETSAQWNEDGEIVDYGTSGQLVFYRSFINCYQTEGGEAVGRATLNDAPILCADVVKFGAGNGEAEHGAKLFFNTYYKEYSYDETNGWTVFAPNDKARNLGTISANKIDFSSNNYVWYDAISNLTPSATMTITLDASEITIDGTKIDVSNSSELADLFGKPLVSTTATQIDGGGFKIEGSAQTVASYASAQGMTKKELNYAAKIDANRLAGYDLEFYDALYNETDAGKVRQTIHNLSLGGYQMLNAYGHFGNPTSSFFGGSTISGEHKRGQTPNPDYPDNPDNPDNPHERQSVQQSAIAENGSYGGDRGVWGAYTNTTVDGSEYDDQGVTMNGYRLKRQGVIGGLRRQIDGSTSCGLFFGLTNPEIVSSGKIQGYGTYGSHMEMDDFQFAYHFEKVFGDFWELSAFVGGGTQSMDWSRNVGLYEGGLYRFNAKGTGNTLTGTLYLANRIDLSDNLTFRPTIGIDSEHSWLFGFGESQTSGGSVDDVNAYMRWLAQPYFYDQTYYNRNTARAGARVSWTGDAGYVGLNAQAFYGVQLGGKESPLISYRSASYAFDNMSTHAMGGESFSVGGGGFVNLNQAKTLTATGDYTAVWYKNATTQNVAGGLSYRF